jgi:hypothetical protein
MIDAVSEQLMQRVVDTHCDAVICAHSDFLDYVFFQSQAAISLRQRPLKMATIAHPQTNNRSLMYNRGDVQSWMSCHVQMIRRAADMLQERILSKKRLLGRFEQIILQRQTSGR